MADQFILANTDIPIDVSRGVLIADMLIVSTSITHGVELISKN